MCEDLHLTEDARPVGDTAEAARLVSLARTLLTQGGSLESTSSGEAVSRATLADALRRRFELNATAGQLPPSLTAKAATAEALAGAESALNKTAGGASPSNLTDLEIAALEAIVEVIGRPSMRYTNGRVQMPPVDLGDNDRWRVLIATVRSKIDRASASVGRILGVAPSGLTLHFGTGWRVGGDLLVTNRHVVAEFVKQSSNRSEPWVIDAAKRPQIDFASDDAAGAQRFEIAELVYYAAEEEIDVAFLRVTSGAEALPPPLEVDWSPESVGDELAGVDGEPSRFRGSEIYVVGHPYRLIGSQLTMAVFGQVDGAKRWSPGLVKRVRADKPLLEHDCSTLSGNSGSCLFTTSGHAVIGIHTGGLGTDLAGRATVNDAVALSRLGQHRAAAILRGEA